MVRFHMRENFGLLHTMQKFLVRGQLDDAKRLAAAMTQAPDEAGLQPWAADATRVRERAAAIAGARNVDDALRAEARLAEACAGCHVEAGVQLAFEQPRAVPPDRPTVEARMARHVWASDRIWEGMLGNVDEPWRTGLDVLAAAPLPTGELGKERAVIAKRFQRLAVDARNQNGAYALSSRAQAYGEILVQCAACHMATP